MSTKLDLRRAPYQLLRTVAQQLAADIDAGEWEKAPLLEEVFLAIRSAPDPQTPAAK